MSIPTSTSIQLALPSLTPSLAIEIVPHGLTIHRIIAQINGKTHDLLIGPENVEHYLDKKHKYVNTIVGRYSNRVPVGTYTLQRNGITSEFTSQANESAKVSLHGGPRGFDIVDWEPLHWGAATLFSDEEKVSIASIPISILFRYISEDGDQGFPGRLLVEVLVGLLDVGQNTFSKLNDELHLGSVYIVYRAKLVEDVKKFVTPVNLTQHWGFNLGASDTESDSHLSVKDHDLTIKSSHTIDLDSDALSTGKLNPVTGTHHEHASKKIGDRFPQSGYDEFYVFDSRPGHMLRTHLPLALLSGLNLIKDTVLLSDAAGGDSPLVDLASSKTGIRLAFDSNQPGVQFYSGNFVSKDGARKKIHGGTGELGKNDGYGPGSAAFLEFHEPLAAWLNPATSPTGNDTLLATGELYNNFVKVDVFYRNPTAA